MMIGSVYTRAISRQSLKNVVNPSLLINADFRSGCLVDQRRGYIALQGKYCYTSIENAQNQTNPQPVIPTQNVIPTSTSGIWVFATGGYYVRDEDVVRGYVGAGYGVDMWKASANMHIEIADDCIKLVKDTDGLVIWHQSVESSRLTSGTWTLSIAYLDGGVLKVGWVTFSLTVGAVIDTGNISIGGGWYCDLQASESVVASGRYLVRLYSQGAAGAYCQPVAVKLELGDQQTLGHQDGDGNWILNEAPIYADTLRECQRYYYRLTTSDTEHALGAYTVVAPFAANSGGTRVVFRLPSPLMRKRPTISASGTLYIKSSSGSISKDLSALTLAAQANDVSGTNITFDTTDFSANAYGDVIIDRCDIRLSAEL